MGSWIMVNLKNVFNFLFQWSLHQKDTIMYDCKTLWKLNSALLNQQGLPALLICRLKATWKLRLLSQLCLGRILAQRVLKCIYKTIFINKSWDRVAERPLAQLLSICIWCSSFYSWVGFGVEIYLPLQQNSNIIWCSAFYSWVERGLHCRL